MYISKQKVIDQLGMTTAYLGAKSDQYSQLALTEGDSALMDRLWSECGSELAVELQDTSGTIDVEPQRMTVSVDKPRSVARSIVKTIVSYLVNSMLSKWLKACNRPDAEHYAELARAIKDCLREVLKRPLRPILRRISPM